MSKECGSPFVFPVRIKDVSRLDIKTCMEKLGKRGVEIRSLMGGTITEQPAYRHLPTDSLANCLTISEQVSESVPWGINRFLTVITTTKSLFLWEITKP